MGTDSSVPRPERELLRPEVLRRLRARILTGELIPGTPLREIPLSLQLGSSRGPVREALRQLEQEGLVEYNPNRGAVVIGVPDHELETVFVMRAVLEGRAFARASRLATDTDLDELEAVAQAMTEVGASGDVDEEMTDLDLGFHRRVVELSGLRFLQRQWTSIDGLIRVATSRFPFPQPMTPEREAAYIVQNAEEHFELLRALRTRDPAIASDAAQAHTEDALHWFQAAYPQVVSDT